MEMFTVNIIFLKIRLATLLEYIISTSPVLFSGFFACLILINLFAVLSSFWLSYWSNTNIGVNNMTAIDRDLGIMIYSISEISQSKFNNIKQKILI